MLAGDLRWHEAMTLEAYLVLLHLHLLAKFIGFVAKLAAWFVLHLVSLFFG